MQSSLNLSRIKIGTYKLFERVLGKKHVRSIYMDMCIRRYRKANCIFVHIPKAAGTTIAHAVIGKRVGHFTAMELKHRMGTIEFNNFFSFSVTRHPYDRLLSAYNYVKSRGGEHGGVRNEVYFNSPTFDSFDSFVQEWLVNENLGTTNLLFRPQIQFVYDNYGQLLVDHVSTVYHLESLKEVLRMQLGKEIDFGFKNRNYQKSTNMISSETKKVIAKLYQEDFERFGYES